MTNAISDVDALETLVEALGDLKSRLGTWQAVGDRFGVSRVIAWRIVNDGYEPKDNAVRRKLGLPELIYFRASRDARGRYQRKA